MAEEEKIMVVPATMGNLEVVIGFVEKQLDAAACPANVKMQICVSLEEVYVNVVNYAYDKDVGVCEILSKVEAWEKGNAVKLTIRDRGKTFNPLEKEDPDITLSAQERQIGGLGIYMVKESMDCVTYAYNAGYNILTLYKKWEVETGNSLA